MTIQPKLLGLEFQQKKLFSFIKQYIMELSKALPISVLSLSTSGDGPEFFKKIIAQFLCISCFYVFIVDEAKSTIMI